MAGILKKDMTGLGKRRSLDLERSDPYPYRGKRAPSSINSSTSQAIHAEDVFYRYGHVFRAEKVKKMYLDTQRIYSKRSITVNP
jgi:hypothetical protein